jgi:3D (Asp-Asp-Asp) domain-containing protein
VRQGESEKNLKTVIIAVALVLVFGSEPVANEVSRLVRVTVYWPSEGSGKSAAWNGARLREGNCAVDPKKIPYGSKVLFNDGECRATDTGPGVVKRKAARSCGQTAAERSAIVIDRFFDTKQKALAWGNAHPHFMTVRVQTPEIAEARD